MFNVFFYQKCELKHLRDNVILKRRYWPATLFTDISDKLYLEVILFWEKDFLDLNLNLNTWTLTEKPIPPRACKESTLLYPYKSRGRVTEQITIKSNIEEDKGSCVTSVAQDPAMGKAGME